MLDLKFRCTSSIDNLVSTFLLLYISAPLPESDRIYASQFSFSIGGWSWMNHTLLRSQIPFPTSIRSRLYTKFNNQGRFRHFNWSQRNNIWPDQFIFPNEKDLSILIPPRFWPLRPSSATNTTTSAFSIPFWKSFFVNCDKRVQSEPCTSF
jgi:hypothetical protein